ncbi:MAG: type IV toxin-antitoxin system AbiEi family antitoxin domain-containing protein, partial [Actinomycetota bacterium]|nr:type IV toxin-antitoxin system AbiEi family antitoxin domain-containing protein [Actinomycetota bacterium]
MSQTDRFALARHTQADHSLAMRPHLRSFTSRQAGVFTCAQAKLCGYAEAEIQRLVRRGAWVRVRRGAYIERTAWVTADADERHLLKARAVLLALADGSVLSHDTAALVHGLPNWGLD